MECCLCLSDAPEFRVCKICSRVFCLICIEIEEENNLHILNKNNICIYCRIKKKYLIKDCS
jgi:hypothetical protein